MNTDYEVLSQIDTETLLSELAYRTANFSKYKLLEGKFNSFKDYDGHDWAVKLLKIGGIHDL